MEVDSNLFFWKIENPRFLSSKVSWLKLSSWQPHNVFFFSCDDLSFRWDKTPSERGQKKDQVKLPRSFSREKSSFFSLFWWQRFQQTKHPWSLTANSPPKKRVIDWKMILSFDMKRHFLTFPIEYVKLRGCMKMNMSVLVLKMKEFFALPWIFFSDPRTRYKPWVRWLLSQN